MSYLGILHKCTFKAIDDKSDTAISSLLNVIDFDGLKDIFTDNHQHDSAIRWSYSRLILSQRSPISLKFHLHHIRYILEMILHFLTE